LQDQAHPLAEVPPLLVYTLFAGPLLQALMPVVHALDVLPLKY
jgi:hypothetical protein